MADGQSVTVADVVAQVRDGRLEDFVKEAVAIVARELMDAQISAEVGAGLGEVAPETRLTHRNGYPPRPWETRVREIELLVPKKRSGSSYFPSFLEPRRGSEQAIIAVVLEAYVNGVSTRKVDWLVEHGIDGMTKDRVSALCRALDEQVELFRQRPLEGGRLPLSVARCEGAPRGAVGSCWVQDSTAGLSRQPGEAEGSLTPELRGRVASSPDNDATATCGDCRTVRARLARRTVCDESEPVIEAPQANTPGSNRMDTGRMSGAREPRFAGRPVCGGDGCRPEAHGGRPRDRHTKPAAERAGTDPANHDRPRRTGKPSTGRTGAVGLRPVWNARRSPLNSGGPWPSPSSAQERVLGIQRKLHKWSIDDQDWRFKDLHNLVRAPERRWDQMPRPAV